MSKLPRRPALPMTKQKGKGGKAETLGSRFAQEGVTGTDPVSRSLGNYAKNSPYKLSATKPLLGRK